MVLGDRMQLALIDSAAGSCRRFQVSVGGCFFLDAFIFTF